MVVLQKKYEELQNPPPHHVTPERDELNTFLMKLLETIKQLPKNEVKHCDSLICELELICELDLEYIMCPTDPYVHKTMCTQERWHSSNRTVPARDSGDYAVRPTNTKKYRGKAGWKYKNNLIS